MLTRLVRLQLIAFLVVSALGVSYAAVRYLEIPRLLGFGSYRVTLALPATAGLYHNALVTYRGVHAGKVDTIDVDRGGVRIVLSIDNSATIPADSAVSVRSTSAIGENYVDFAPRSASAPLHDGQVIAAGQVTMPMPSGALLESWQQLATTLPLDKLNNTMVETHQAFQGTGPYLAGFLNSADRLQHLADANLDPTTALIRDLVPVLATQQHIAGDVRSFSGDLADVTGTLRTSDTAIRGSIDQVPPLADQIDSLFNQVSPTLPQLLTDLTSTAQVTRVYIPHLRHTLTVFPATMSALNTVSNRASDMYGESPTPVAGANFKLGFNDPPACVTGYEPERIAPSDISNSHPPAFGSWCKEPKDSPISVRGLRNTPCPPGSPAGPGATGATAAECGWHFQTPEQAAAATAEAVKFQLAVAARNPKTRAENDAFQGTNRPPAPARNTAPGINDPWLPAQQDTTAQQSPTGLFLAGNQPFLNGNQPAAPATTTPAASGLQQYLLAPLTSRS